MKKNVEMTAPTAIPFHHNQQTSAIDSKRYEKAIDRKSVDKKGRLGEGEGSSN